LMDTSPALRTYIVNQLGEISISEALYPWIILLEQRPDLTITLWEWEVCYTVTRRQLNPTLSLIRSRCKNKVGLVDRIAPSNTIHGKDPIRLVLVEAWLAISAWYQFYTSLNIKYIPTPYQAKISLETKLMTKLVWKSLKVWT
jgi:hypothetical protein